MTDNLKEWQQRWVDGRTGWHLDEPHAGLVQHASSDWSRVLVPLCGASLDLGWLADSGREVVGIDASPIAAKRVFEQRGETPQTLMIGELQVYQHGRLSVAVGDFFTAASAGLAPFDAVWDRAALVAIDPATRSDYVGVLRRIAPGAQVLLAAFDYEPGVITGPPHALSPGQVEDLLPGAELLAESDISLEQASRGREGAFVERLYRAVISPS